MEMTFGDTLHPARRGVGARMQDTRAAVASVASDAAPDVGDGSGLDAPCAGLEVGHFTDTRRPTGCTVVLARDGAVAGVDVRGAAPGTRETELLDPVNAVERVHAIVLAGGSAFGLDAAGGVMRWLDERGIGFDGRPARGADRAGGDPVRPVGRRRRDPARRGRRLCGLRGGVSAIAAPRATSARARARRSASSFGIERAMKGGIGSASVTVGRHHGRARSSPSTRSAT